MAVYKGHELKEGVKIRKEIRDGKEVTILDIPAGCKNPYKDLDNSGVKKKSAKMNPVKEKILEKLLEALKEFSPSGQIYKTKEGKYCILTSEGKWFSMGLIGNKTEPKDKEIYNEEAG